MTSIPKRDGKKLIDDMWLYTALAMIGENFEAGEELCGAVIRCRIGWATAVFTVFVTVLARGLCSLRKAGDRVAVWTKTAEDEKACLEIGAQFRSAIAECLQGEVWRETTT